MTTQQLHTNQCSINTKRSCQKIKHTKAEMMPGLIHFLTKFNQDEIDWIVSMSSIVRLFNSFFRVVVSFSFSFFPLDIGSMSVAATRWLIQSKLNQPNRKPPVQLLTHNYQIIQSNPKKPTTFRVGSFCFHPFWPKSNDNRIEMKCCGTSSAHSNGAFRHSDRQSHTHTHTRHTLTRGHQSRKTRQHDLNPKTGEVGKKSCNRHGNW